MRRYIPEAARYEKELGLTPKEKILRRNSEYMRTGSDENDDIPDLVSKVSLKDIRAMRQGSHEGERGFSSKDFPYQGNKPSKVSNRLRGMKKSGEARQRIQDLRRKRINRKLSKGQYVLSPPSKNASNTVRKFHREDYEFLLNHLIEEGYTSSYESANKIVGSMSETWITSIL